MSSPDILKPQIRHPRIKNAVEFLSRNRMFLLTVTGAAAAGLLLPWGVLGYLVGAAGGAAIGAMSYTRPT